MPSLHPRIGPWKPFSGIRAWSDHPGYPRNVLRLYSGRPMKERRSMPGKKRVVRVPLSSERRRIRRIERLTPNLRKKFNDEVDWLEWVEESRAKDGLPPTVEDDETIASVVNELRPWQASANES
jgi:hypothetical protein